MMSLDVRAFCLVGALLAAAAFITVGAQDSTTEGQEPFSTEVVEETGRELVQLDVSIRPRKKNDKSELPELTPDDLELVVSGRRIEIRYADRLCRSIPEQPGAVENDVAVDAAETAATPQPIVVPNPVATYVFYIEHKHVTVAGLNVALEMIEQLIPELIRDGNRGIVVSSGLDLNQSELSDDPEVLFDALGAIRSNPRQWTEYDYAATEEQRIVDVMSQQTTAAQQARARVYQREEAMITSNRLTRLSAVIGSLTDLDPPKAVFYFSDTIRKNAGLHYLRLIGGGGANNPDAPESQLGAFSSEFAMDRVTEEAGAHGVRLYTIRAEGLRSESMTRGARIPEHRIADAEDTMRSLALETGGSYYLGGTDGKTMSRIVRQAEADLSCFYLLSFDPTDLKRDAKLPVRVRFNVDSKRAEELSERYEIHARGQLVVMSPGRRKESLLLAAHISSSNVESEPSRGAVIPLGFEDGSFIALIQLAVDNSDFPEGISRGAVWDLGMSRVHRQAVVDAVSTRVELSDPRAPVVLETTWSFKPGPSEVVAIAYENTVGRLVTAEFDQAWPDPSGADVSISPIAVVQQSDAVFVRALKDGKIEQRRSGPLAAEDGTMRVDRPTYVIALVCRDKGFKKDLWVARELVGETAVEFGLQTWDYDGQRCVQLRDRIDADQVGWGDFEYRIRVYEDAELVERPIAEASRAFVATAGDSTLSMLD
jgi:hypothetical protein